MAGWMIKINEYYLEPVHRMMKETLKLAPLMHCDETPFIMSGEKDKDDPYKVNNSHLPKLNAT